MSAALNYLSLEQFEELYRDQKPNYEYWFGEAVQKIYANYFAWKASANHWDVAVGMGCVR